MRIGILSDTHDRVVRTRSAVSLLQAAEAEAVVHCGDLTSPEIVAVCSQLPLYFVFGNHDADTVPELRAAALDHQATCLGWGGALTLAGKTIAVAHGHLTMDLKPLLDNEPDYLFSGHSHTKTEFKVGKTHRVNPGALHRATEFSVALVDLAQDEVSFITVPR